MRSPLLWLSCAVAALLLLPAAAPAKLTVGIGENNPGVFYDPLFAKMGAKHARVVVSWNVMTRHGDDEINRVREYLAAAQAAGVQPLVTFEHARGDATICNKRRNRRKAVCKLPTPAQYERNIRLFRDAFPHVRAIVPWNEINHFTQPTYRNPKAAARFTTIARRVFRGRTVLAADILDQADSTRARRPTFRSATRYIERFRRAYKGPRKICGVHNYSDVNRFRSTGTRAIVKALGCRQIWLTEAGGIYKFGPSFKASQKRQLRATKYMFKVARSIKRVTRLYVYTWFGGVTSRFDAGLVANGKPRRAYGVVRKQVRRGR
jgi:hypothetical protein